MSRRALHERLKVFQTFELQSSHTNYTQGRIIRRDLRYVIFLHNSHVLATTPVVMLVRGEYIRVFGIRKSLHIVAYWPYAIRSGELCNGTLGISNFLLLSLPRDASATICSRSCSLSYDNFDDL